MFRLADIEENTPLFNYISSIASKTIYNALDDLFGDTLFPVEDFYYNTFSGDVLENDFFEGLSQYIKERADVTADEFGTPYSPDTRAGIELIFRKVRRMKEKMLDPEKNYTFDLLEEFLFNSVIEFFYMINVESDGRDPEEERKLEKSINETIDTLINTYEFDEDEAEEMAEAAWKIEKMGIDSSDAYFWDDDYAIVFADGFVKGIRNLVGGYSAMLGYGYEDICSIFTDCGIKAPLRLVGTKAAFDTVGEVTQQRMAEAMRSIPMPESLKNWPEEGEDWPFN